MRARWLRPPPNPLLGKEGGPERPSFSRREQTSRPPFPRGDQLSGPAFPRGDQISRPPFPRGDYRGVDPRGFTLLEVLIAVFVVSWAFVTLLGLHARGVQSVIRDQNRTRATLVAREVISTIEYTVATRGLQGLSNTEGTSESYPDFHYQVEVSPTELEEVRMVIVHIAWDDTSPPAQVIYYVRETAPS